MSTRGFDIKAVAGKHPEPEQRVDVLVIGAGIAGVAAAIEAATSGASVLLIDENPVGPGLMGLDTPLYYGGRYTAAIQTKPRMVEQVFAARPDLEAAFEAGVEIELGVYCWGAFVAGAGLVSLPMSLAGLADETRSWMVGFETAIVATGARDVAFAFEGWDQPGVMGAAGFHALTRLYDAFSGRRVVVLGSGALAARTALDALDLGLEVVALIEVEGAPRAPRDLLDRLRAGRVDILTETAPLRAAGGLDGVESLLVRSLASGAERTLVCDTVIQAVAITPTVELLDVLGARIAMRPRLGGHAPVSEDGVTTSLPNVFVAGDAAGAPGGSHRDDAWARASGRRAALAALGRAIKADADLDEDGFDDSVAYQQTWMRALMETGDDQVIICQCEAVTREALLAVRQPTYLGPPSPGMARRDIGRLLEDGPAQPDQIKRLTRACMGPCQARRCREQVALALACASNETADRVPLMGYRAPVRPLPLSVIADWDEAPLMSESWDVWFGIPGQWIPYDDIGTEREARYQGLLGSDMHT